MPDEPEDSDSRRDYRALIYVALGRRSKALLHLIREDAEASLCGIPRSSLQRGGILNELICRDCIEWLHKRGMASGEQQRMVDPANS